MLNQKNNKIVEQKKYGRKLRVNITKSDDTIFQVLTSIIKDGEIKRFHDQSNAVW